MARSAFGARLVRSLIVVAALGGCDGKLVRLGAGVLPPDAGPADVGPGTAGAAGTSAASGGGGGGVIAASGGAGGGGAGGGGAAGGAAGGAGGSPCPHANIPANQVLWIGDGWVVQPGTQHTVVRDLARTSGAIGMTDDYVVAAANGATMNAIASQYATQEATTTKVKVLIMDGGTIDTIASNGSAASVSSVAATFGQLLSTIAADGTVQQIIYFLVPDLPQIPGVAALRTPMQQACAQSAVACTFIDLQRQLMWTDHADYTAANGILPTDTGAQAIADLIWSTMQQDCIAQ